MDSTYDLLQGGCALGRGEEHWKRDIQVFWIPQQPTSCILS